MWWSAGIVLLLAVPAFSVPAKGAGIPDQAHYLVSAGSIPAAGNC